MCVSVCPPSRIVITRAKLINPSAVGLVARCGPHIRNWLNKFYSFCMAAIVGIISRRDLRNEVRCRNQPSKSKLALYKPLLHFYSHLKQLYISNKME